ncbi:MAG: aldehyde dehydrogenase family protein [Verrucomicrobia bacterium]|nr:aldehyde dehydrogenase family protein [Verrucomicrobiota bacterium]
MKKYCVYIAGEAVESSDWIDVNDPYTGEIVGRVPSLGEKELDRAVEATHLRGREVLTRFQRFEILNRAKEELSRRAEEFSALITSESGLCVRESRYEVGRASDVLQFAAMEALKDDGQIFSCDLTPHGKARKIFTLREPLQCIASITPFNHPLNQVAHKVAPAIAAGAPTVLKPSLKTPLTAIRFVELLYSCGLPGWMLSVLTGVDSVIAEGLVRHPLVEMVSFTGSEKVGKRIAREAGYKKVVLELGGNDPLIVLSDADMQLAVKLACEGSFRNSGQRCTAVKRILVERGILDEFVGKFVEMARSYRSGNPRDPETVVGTVIDEAAAKVLEERVIAAVASGARVLLGGKRLGALMEPTIIVDVPRDCEMVVKESFGPLAPIMVVDDLEDAIQLTNSTAYGLSSGIVTRDLNKAIYAVKKLRVGTCNINEVPGYRIESSPFGGIKDSGLGIKEGVIEAMKFMSNIKTFSLPW